MPIELRSMEEESGEPSKINLALVGAEQNGKSLLAATGRDPVLFHDFDNKWQSLRGRKGVFVKTYIDPQWPNQPTATQDLLTMISKMEESLDLADLGFKVPRGTLVRTNVLDSVATCAKAAQNYAMFNSTGLRREIVFGNGKDTFKVFIPGGWDAWNAEMKTVENLVLRMMALPTDFIMTLHETAEETPDSGDGSKEKPKKFTGRIDVYPSRYRSLLKYFSEIWRVKLTQVLSTDGKNQLRYLPRVYPLPTAEFDSGTTLLLDSVEDPNIKAMLLKHQQKATKSLGATAPKSLTAAKI